MDYKEIKSCRICGTKKLTEYLDLGEVPLCNQLLNVGELSKEQYPIKMLLCPTCFLSQLSIVVDPKILYSSYLYHSSISNTFKNHCRDMARTIKDILRPEHNCENFLVVDIASNDGCLLEQFKNEGYYTMGVEPSKNLVDEAEKKGISTIHGFWGESIIDRVPACDVITATNVFAHVDDVRGFIELAKNKLRVYHKGMIVIEIPYAANLFNYMQFDTIYHEHLSYFLFKPLYELFLLAGCPIFRVDHVPMHGGSLRIYASPYDRTVDKSVPETLIKEEAMGFYKEKTYHEFRENIEFIREDLPFLLFSLNEEGKKVMGYGASAKGISLLNYCGLNHTDIHSIVDETPCKIGKITPGSLIPIVSFSAFEKEKPDYILLLAWNFSEELIAKTKHLGAKYIIPIPQVVVLP